MKMLKQLKSSVILQGNVSDKKLLLFLTQELRREKVATEILCSLKSGRVDTRLGRMENTRSGFTRNVCCRDKNVCCRDKVGRNIWWDFAFY